MNGWIKLHRSLLDSSVFANPKLLKVWMWCLMKASHKDREVLVGNTKVQLKEGQFIFGRKKAAKELNMPEANVYRYIKCLESVQNVSIKPNNKYSVVTIEKWGIYQACETESEQVSEQQMNNKRTTNEQQMNTNKNVKNVKKVKNIYIGVPSEIKNAFMEWAEMRKRIKKPITNKQTVTRALNTLNRITTNTEEQIKLINTATDKCWLSFYPPKEEKRKGEYVSPNANEWQDLFGEGGR